MELPFTAEQFFGVFRAYNTTLWPVQLFLLSLAGLGIVLVMWSRRWSGVGVSAILAFLWGWMGLASPRLLHLHQHTGIRLRGGFPGGRTCLFWNGVIQHRLDFRWQAGARGVTALLLVVCALVVYPAWSHFAGQPYLETPTFGLPCPTTIFTMGLLACLVRPYPRSVLVVLILWSLAGVQAAFLLSVPQDIGLAVVAVVGLVLVWKAGSPTASPPEAAGATP